MWRYGEVVGIGLECDTSPAFLSKERAVPYGMILDLVCFASSMHMCSLSDELIPTKEFSLRAVCLLSVVSLPFSAHLGIYRFPSSLTAFLAADTLNWIIEYL